MADRTPELIKAIVAALKAASSVTSLVGQRVYVDVPQKTDFPYLVVSVSSEPFAANDFSGQSHIVRLQARSQAKSSIQAVNVRKAAIEALDRNEGTITLEAGSLIKCEYSGASLMFKEDDGKTWQAVGELQALTV